MEPLFSYLKSYSDIMGLCSTLANADLLMASYGDGP